MRFRLGEVADHAGDVGAFSFVAQRGETAQHARDFAVFGVHVSGSTTDVSWVGRTDARLSVIGKSSSLNFVVALHNTRSPTYYLT